MHFRGRVAAQSLVHKASVPKFAAEAIAVGASACATVGASATPVEAAVCVSDGESDCVGDLRHAVTVARRSVKAVMSCNVFIVRLDASNAFCVDATVIYLVRADATSGSC